ncbi:hypothetical protein OIU74_023790 [Salix koriyanagi]|uniref:Uncharacterized protein n=1 Tax=Salix koriyanagi TaxID=2511006 RepID=A0A9Q1ABD1_9ROSI|nr:hypothetical protein OIU74_023790 [Salix koriyanagi]
MLKGDHFPYKAAAIGDVETTDTTDLNNTQDDDECEEEGEDLLNGNFKDDYRRMDEHDRDDPVGLDESFEDDMDTDQVIQDRKVAGLKLEARDVCFSNRKLPQLLHDNNTYDDSYRPSKRSRVDSSVQEAMILF